MARPQPPGAARAPSAEALLGSAFVAFAREHPSGLLVVALPDGRVILQSRHLTALLKTPRLPPVDIAGHAAYELSTPDGVPLEPRECPVIRALLEGDVVGPEELRALRPDGSPVRVRVVAAPLRDADGRVFAAAMTVDEVERPDSTAARDAEAMFRSLHESSPVGQLLLDAEGRIMISNDAAGRIVGRDVSELIHRALPELADEGPEGRASIEAALASSAAWTGHDVPFHRPDGSTAWADVTLARAAKDGAPRPTTLVDVTEDRRARTERTFFQRLALRIGAAPELDTALRATLEEVCGVADWRLGEVWMPAPHTSHLVLASKWHAADASFEAFDAAAASLRFARGQGLPGRAWEQMASVWSRDVRNDPEFVRKSEASIAGLGAGVAVPVLSGPKVVAVLAFYLTEPRLQDERAVETLSSVAAQLGGLIERKQVEDLVVNLQQRHELILSSVAEGVYGLDTEGRAMFTNQAAIRLTGWTERDLKGVRLHDVLHDRMADGTPRPASTCPIYETLRDGRHHAVDDDVFWQRDGSPLRVSYVSAPLLEGGRVVGAVVTFHDITERKATEEALAAKSRELARSNEELTQFAYVASHDLQEPLRMIASYQQLIEKRYNDKLDDDGREFISFAVDGAQRMQALINGLLSYSRVGRKGGKIYAVSADRILAGVLSDVAPLIEEASATITHDPLPRVMADPRQVGQLFQNLLTNAIKFRASDPPRVHVTSRPLGEMVEFAVRDNGIGIEANDMARIFRIFQRLHTRAEIPGTGIGLALCKRIAERHGGSIRVESEIGQGSTFYVTLPAAPVEGEA